MHASNRRRLETAALCIVAIVVGTLAVLFAAALILALAVASLPLVPFALLYLAYPAIVRECRAAYAGVLLFMDGEGGEGGIELVDVSADEDLPFSAVNPLGFWQSHTIAQEAFGTVEMTQTPSDTHDAAEAMPEAVASMLVFEPVSQDAASEVIVTTAANGPADDGRTYRVEWRLAADGRASGKPGPWKVEAASLTHDEATALVAHLDEWQDSETRIVAERKVRAKNAAA